MLKGYQHLPLSTLSDALDTLSLAGQCQGIKPIFSTARIAGPCFTIAYQPIEEAGSDKTVGDYIDDVPKNHIVLIANDGREDCTVWGDILTLAAARRKLGGTVIDGVCRDVQGYKVLKYPVFARNSFMRTGKGRVALKSVQQPVRFCGLTVAPGDIVVGGTEGLLVIPAAFESKVLEKARKIEALEAQIRNAVMRGVPLKEARKTFGYHSIHGNNKK